MNSPLHTIVTELSYYDGVWFTDPSGSMIGLSWNVRGLGNPRAFAALKWLMKKHSPEFVFLSKTKISGSKAVKVRDNIGNYEVFWVDCIGCSGGLMLLWKKELQVTVISYSVEHIDARIKMEDGFHWRFSGVYGDPSPSKRVNSWDLMGRLSEVDSLPWVCGRDFNEVLCMNKKLGGYEKSISGMIRFRQAIDKCDLIDLGSTSPRYTWNNKREGKYNIQERIDRYFANNLWRDRFEFVMVENLGFNSSDHRPIQVSDLNLTG